MITNSLRQIFWLVAVTGLVSSIGIQAAEPATPKFRISGWIEVVQSVTDLEKHRRFRWGAQTRESDTPE